MAELDVYAIWLIGWSVLMLNNFGNFSVLGYSSSKILNFKDCATHFEQLLTIVFSMFV